jgi:DMSO reductase anchor subunit
MHPAFSILFFTTLAGAGQGLACTLAIAVLMGISMDSGFLLFSLVLSELLLVAGLGASFLHLGHKMRAWRAVLMWRTSWMSREVIVMPAFIALVGLWIFLLALHVNGPWVAWLPLLVLAGALLLWYCTAMIYACLRFIQEWAHPLTVINFMLMGLSSGAVLACALAEWNGEAVLAGTVAPWALAATLAAWGSRALSLQRNAGLKPKSTTQSATGIQSGRLVQKSMGMSAGSFNTREFFHGASHLAVKNIKWFFLLALFALPALLQAVAITTGGTSTAVLWCLAVVLQAPGLVAERWFFFAQAQHPQNLYYQTVS